MEYDVVFEIAKVGIMESIPIMLFSTLLMVVGIGIIKFFEKFFGYLFFGFAVLWTLVVGLKISSAQSLIKEYYGNGNFEVVEGFVENFKPMPSDGGKQESFTVNGIRFKYADYVKTPGFNNAASRGGPIREGLQVKISYIDNTILKLEVAASTNKRL